MALIGADTDELREVGQEFEQGKEVVDDVITFLRALIAVLRAASFFSGGASLAYAEYLETTVVPWLQKISQALGLFATVLSAQAQAQDDTSDGARVDLATLPTYTTPALPEPLAPYAGPPVVGGPADGAVAAGGTRAGHTTTTTTTTTGPGGVPITTTTTTTTSGAGGATGAPHTTPPATVGTLASSIPSAVPTGTSTPGAPGSLGVPGALPTGAASGHAADTTVPTLGSRTLDAGHQSAGSHGVAGQLGSSGGTGSGSAGGISAGGGLPGAGHGALGSSGGLDGAGTTGAGGASVHTNAPLDGGLGGATPGGSALGQAGQALGQTSGQLAAGGHPSSDSPVGAVALGAAASGAAALGVGGAALAARGKPGDGSIDALAATNGRGSRGPAVTALQEQLTAAGYDTRGADGTWGGNTQRAFEAYRADHPLEIRQGTGYTSPDGYDYSRITGISNTTPEFLRAVEGVSQRLGARPEHLLAAMSFETGGRFAPDVRNPHSSATGLIQFMDSTAQRMGTTTTALAAMSPTEQLTYVERYLEPFRGRLGDLDSVYSSILAGHPASGDTPLFAQGTPAYAANAPLDTDHDGRITAAEAASHVRTRLGSGS